MSTQKQTIQKLFCYNCGIKYDITTPEDKLKEIQACPKCGGRLVKRKEEK